MSTENPSPDPTRKGLKWWLNRLLTPLLVLLCGIVLIVIIGFAQRVGWISSGGPSVPATGSESAEIYTCPMHPQIRQPGPGRCPICAMQLVPATSATGDDDSLTSLTIATAQRRLANIQTAVARREPVAATIHTVGSIAIDESRLATVASYIDGRLERLFADYTGVEVAKGDHLAVVYSPELYAAQVEYIESRSALARMNNGALAAVRQVHQKLVENSRLKLVELGMQSDQLSQLENDGKPQSRLTIYTPIGGTVIEKLAMEGKYVKAGEAIYRIADLSTVWLVLELYPEDAARIRFGQRVNAEVQSLPGKSFEGRVAFIDPTVDVRKRTIGVRVEFLNEGRQLRPGDYANATIYLPIGQEGDVYDADLAGRWISPMHPQIIRDEPGPCPICGMDLVPTSQYGYAQQPVARPTSLYVPRSAVLMAGGASVVYVETEPGRFEIRPVVLGPILRDKVIILQGLEVGDQVATSGNFLIDSQMQLAGKPSLIDPTRAVAKTKERTTPLEITDKRVELITGETGGQIEELYQAYFRVQKDLAADTKPSEQDATTLFRSAQSLASNVELSADVRDLLTQIAKSSEHLHHLSLDAARIEAFRPLSHAVVRLAAEVRGDAAETVFQQMFCPMVQGGSGDWLQADDELRNPYFGSAMLTCGEIVRPLPLDMDTSPTPADADDQSESLRSDTSGTENGS